MQAKQANTYIVLVHFSSQELIGVCGFLCPCAEEITTKGWPLLNFFWELRLRSIQSTSKKSPVNNFANFKYSTNLCVLPKIPQASTWVNCKIPLFQAKISVLYLALWTKMIDPLTSKGTILHFLPAEGWWEGTIHPSWYFQNPNTSTFNKCRGPSISTTNKFWANPWNTVFLQPEIQLFFTSFSLGSWTPGF